MFEIKQATIDEGSLDKPFPSDKFNTEEKDGLHNDVVLEMDVYLKKAILSKRMKGMEK